MRQIEVAMRVRALAAALLLVVSLPAAAQTPQPGWIADARSGCRVWNPAPQPKEAITWSGACQNGLAQGRGVLQWYQDNKPSERSEGEFRDGKLNGRGILIGANGDRYDGDFRDGRQNGRGAATFTNGDRYEGEWRDGNPNGVGRLARANGDVFNGIWANGCFRDGNRWAAAWVDPSTCH